MQSTSLEYIFNLENNISKNQPHFLYTFKYFTRSSKASATSLLNAYAPNLTFTVSLYIGKSIINPQSQFKVQLYINFT